MGANFMDSGDGMTMARELMDSRRYAKMHLSRLEKVLLLDTGTAVTLTSLDSLVSTSRRVTPDTKFSFVRPVAILFLSNYQRIVVKKILSHSDPDYR